MRWLPAPLRYRQPRGGERARPLRQRVGLLLGPLLFALILLRPPSGLNAQESALLAVLALVVIYWLTEPIPLPMTSLAGVALAVVVGAADTGEAFAGFADPTVFLLIGSFIIVAATHVHGLDRRIGYALMSHRWVGESTYRTIWALGLTAVVISAWVNNSATAAMLFPAAIAIGATATERLGRAGASRYRAALLLMLAYAVSIGGMVTPVGTPTNLLGLALLESATGISIPFFAWVVIGGSIAILMLIVLFGLLLLLMPPEMRTIPGQQEDVRKETARMGAWTRDQRLVAAVVGATIAFWILPGLAELALGADHRTTVWLHARLPESVIAIIAAGMFFILPAGAGGSLLKWEHVATIDWGTVLLLGGGAALGRMAVQTGLAAEFGNAILRADWLRTAPGILLAALLIAVVLSELVSNTAAVNLIVPIVLGVATASDLPLADLAAGATLGASLGFMLPVATPPNAMIYGSGDVTVRDMIRIGLLLDLAGVAIIWLLITLLGPLVLPGH